MRGIHRLQLVVVVGVEHFSILYARTLSLFPSHLPRPKSLRIIWSLSNKSLTRFIVLYLVLGMLANPYCTLSARFEMVC
ncbi:hypothetical protein EBB07_14000 [Paenibacillaceae bacterium]|nr:hypothetical protein EBB07_14000 [Paenibacillaceae bacterium]